MHFAGTLRKMLTEEASTINYFLNFKDDFISVNQLLEREIKIELKGYQCLNCLEEKEIFRQGFCKRCFFDSPQAGDWIMRPELSTAHLDIEDRNLDYEKKVQLQPHIVYLAFSSHIKVGVTRKSQTPTRWIDQGANEALSILEVPNRYLSGISEVALKDVFSDKTNWRKMLQTQTGKVDWQTEKEKAIAVLPNEVKEYIQKGVQTIQLNFPVLQYPEKIKSLNLNKEKSFQGKLMGVKGQYLIFEGGTVFNVRSNEGLVVDLELA